jgi:hypothetical protein
MDHVHIFSGTGITNGLKGALAGGPGAGPAAGGVAAAVLGGPGAEDTSSSDQTTATPAVSAASSSSTGGGGVSLPSSFSGLSSFGLDSLGVKTKASPDSPERNFDIGGAASAAVSGQVSSALGVFGVGDSPPILKAASQLLGGLKVGGHERSANGQLSGNSDGSLFSGSNLFGGGQSAAALSALPPDGVQHGSSAGQAPGPGGTTYIINARDTEDSFVRANRIEREKAAAKLSRY